MTEKQTPISHQIEPPSPLDPYRGIMEHNPIEDHFTDKRLRKHMRHVGLSSQTSNNNNKEPISLARNEYQIWNSEKEKLKRYRRKFIATMADTIEEVDQARQAEFRNQLELWDKMFSNRIQRIKTNDRRLERKYGLFVDRQMKKELMRENLPKMPPVPSVSNPDSIRKQRRNRVKPSEAKRANSAPSSRDEITERLSKLENDFSTFINQEFWHGGNDIDLIKKNTEILTKDNNEVRDEINKLKSQIEELQTDLNETVKDQDMLKIIQLEHEEKISQIITTIEIFQQTVNNRLTMQQQQFEQIINDNVKTLRRQIKTSQEEVKAIIYDEMEKLNAEIAILKRKIQNLEEAISTIKLPHTKKKDPLRYVEKLAPMDLFEINWSQYQQENQVNNIN